MVLWFCVQRWSRLEVPASAIGEVCEKVSLDMDQCGAKIRGFRVGGCFLWGVVVCCGAVSSVRLARGLRGGWCCVPGGGLDLGACACSSVWCLLLAGRSRGVRALLLPPVVRMPVALWSGSGVRRSGWSVGGGGTSCRASLGGSFPCDGSF